ncbi:phosphonate ABC transporter substrate-binding protein [Candidatus Pantoea formicae]|uniref:phosphonate ABC transporter substrate-binding protein n=1 Tax=Candidatus Pantoea formicae TaxID=2608355 RepID=UPI003ED8D045
MRLFFMIMGGIAAGILSLIALLYVNMELTYRADLKACPHVTTQQVVAAVVNDVTRKDSHIFGKFHLRPDDVYIDRDSVQIGPSLAHVPFRIASDPDREYFAMPGCSNLDDIEYAND